MRVFDPDTPEGAKAPRDIARQRKTPRRREAFARASLGLTRSPFDEELAYAAGILGEFASELDITVDYFDRYLALRGLRSNDDRNWRGKELSAEEKYALAVVQNYARARQQPYPGVR